MPRVKEVPIASHSDAWNPWNHPTVRQSLRNWLIGAAVLGLGIWGFFTQGVGTHVTECGFDAHGAYAKVRVNNLFGGSDNEHVYVDFSLKGGPSYESGLAVVHKPALGRVTAVIHERFPPPRISTGEGPDFIVEGRTLYRWEGPHVSFTPPYDWRFVSKKFALGHPSRTHEEIVPENPSVLRCTLAGDGW